MIQPLLILFPPALFLLPFTVHWDPYQLLLGSTSLSAKLVSGFSLSVTAYFIFVTWLSVILICVVFLEGLETYSRNLGDSPSIKFLKTFRKEYKKFRIASILLETMRIILETFFCAIVCIAVMLASYSIYPAIKMYNKLNIITYASTLAIVIIIVALILILTYLAGIPYSHLVSFKRLWKCMCWNKREIKMLVACKPSGFTIGPFGTATSL